MFFLYGFTLSRNDTRSVDIPCILILAIPEFILFMERRAIFCLSIPHYRYGQVFRIIRNFTQFFLFFGFLLVLQGPSEWGVQSVLFSIVMGLSGGIYYLANVLDAGFDRWNHEYPRRYACLIPYMRTLFYGLANYISVLYVCFSSRFDNS
jgi:hypothetical protein